MERFWQCKTTFENGATVVRQFRSEKIVCGSHPRAQIKVPLPAPSILFRVERRMEDDREYLIFQTDNPELEVEIGGTFKAIATVRAEKLPRVRYHGTIIEVTEVTTERPSMIFSPEKWAAESSTYEPDYFALWHIRDGVLSEVALLEKNRPTSVLKNGYRVLWSEERPFVLQLIEYDGIPRSIDMKPGRLGVPRAQIDNNVFLVTRVPDKNKIREIQIKEPLARENSLHRWMLGVGATWLLLISLFQFIPQIPHEETLEELPSGVAKIILETPKAVDGGDRMRGGGGVTNTASKDPRGGSGFESERIKASAGGDEAVVKNKGALAAMSKASKVVGTGVMRALAATSKVATALSALDEGMKSGKIKAAGIPSLGGGLGRGSARGVLGALGKVGQGGKGGGGTGIGGVGTQGFGAGGGGGSGNGFGTGVGSGLGKGEGLRSVAFDSDNVAIRGGLERSEVEAVIRENISQIRFCYNRGLRNNPQLSGKVTSAFTIQADGGVKISRIKGSTIAAADVEDCIKNKIASWKFPQPRGGGEVAVSYPFLFKAN